MSRTRLGTMRMRGSRFVRLRLRGCGGAVFGVVGAVVVPVVMSVVLGWGWFPGGRRGSPTGRRGGSSLAVEHRGDLGVVQLRQAGEVVRALDLAEELLEDHRGLDGGPARGG